MEQQQEQVVVPARVLEQRRQARAQQVGQRLLEGWLGVEMLKAALAAQDRAREAQQRRAVREMEREAAREWLEGQERVQRQATLGLTLV